MVNLDKNISGVSESSEGLRKIIVGEEKKTEEETSKVQIMWLHTLTHSLTTII